MYLLYVMWLFFMSSHAAVITFTYPQMFTIIFDDLFSKLYLLAQFPSDFDYIILGGLILCMLYRTSQGYIYFNN